MLALAWLGPVIAAVQHIVPPSMRATASASFLFINNLIGIGFGIFFLGCCPTAMKAAHGADSLQYSILYGLGFLPAQRRLYFVAAARGLKRDWYRGLASRSSGPAGRPCAAKPARRAKLAADLQADLALLRR